MNLTLTNREDAFVRYTRLGMDTAEIARIFCIERHSVADGLYLGKQKLYAQAHQANIAMEEVKELMLGSFEQLSDREAEVASLVALGNTNAQIAEKLVISENTVKKHVQHVMEKMNVSSRAMIAVQVLAVLLEVQ